MLLFYYVLFSPSFILSDAHHAPKYVNSSFVLAVKQFAKIYDSSCATLLFSRDGFKRGMNRIAHIVHSLSVDFNIDLNIKTSTFDYYINTRPQVELITCINPFNILIHCDETTHKEFIHMTKVVPYEEGVIWLISVNSTINLYDYFKDVYVVFNIMMIACQTWSEDEISFFEVYRVAEDRPLRIEPIGKWTRNNGYNITTANIYTRRTNLEGIVFRTGSTQNAPLHSFEKNTHGEMVLVGYFPEVWKQLEEILNFTSVHLPSVDKVTGVPEANGTWSGLIGMLQRREIDIAVSEFIIDRQRREVVDFTKPLVKTSYQLFFKNVGPNYNWDAIVKPFSQSIWLCLLAWVVALSVSLTICHHICRRHNIESYANQNEFSLINSIFFIAKSVCSQGHNVFPASLSCRTIFLTAYLSTAILIPSYSASLISYLTFREPLRPFDSLDELLEDGTYKLQTNEKTAEYTYFSEATDPLHQRIFQELIVKSGNLPLNTQEAFDRICKQPKLAHFGDMAVASSYLHIVKARKNCDIITLRKGISTIYSSMALIRRSPYKSVLNHNLQEMEDYGLIARAREISISMKKVLPEAVTVEVNMKDVAPVFLLLFIGMVFSVVIVVAERIHYKRLILKLNYSNDSQYFDKQSKQTIYYK